MRYIESNPFGEYKRRGHRLSLLGVSRFCPQAATLSERYGAGRAAAISAAFHAKMAQTPGYRLALAKLTESERLDLEQWKAPGDIVTMEGDQRVLLDYASAEKEVLVGLNEHGGYVDPTQSDVFLRGYIDFAWVREVHGKRVAYVCDIKRSEWTTVEGPDDLQVVAYGFAFAEMRECDAFVTAIWSAMEGTWTWGEFVELGEPASIDLWRSVRAAGSNTTGNAVTGQHCRGCYARLHCPEHVLPAVTASTELAGLAEGQELTPGNALKALLTIQAAEEVLDKAKETLKEAVNRGLVIRDTKTGKVWKMIQCRGRESVKMDELRAEIGEEVFSRFVKRGAPYQRPGWVKG